MTHGHAPNAEADRSLDALFAGALPRGERTELEHARARRALLAAAEVAVVAAPAAHRRRLHIVTALAFAATAAAAATLATRFEAARHASQPILAEQSEAIGSATFSGHANTTELPPPEAAPTAPARRDDDQPLPHAPRRPAAPAAAARPDRTVAEHTSPDAPTAGARFAEAMAAYLAHDDARADTLFGSFADDFPSDSRVEDALFLRAETRSRRGDEAGTRAAARAYLKRFPAGLRRPEAERLAAEGH